MSDHHLHNPATPVVFNELDSDLHAVNREIDRVAFMLHVDLSNSAQIHGIIEGTFAGEAHHGEHIHLLRGLLILRGKIRQNRLESGLPDGPSPMDEDIYTLLRVHADNDC